MVTLFREASCPAFAVFSDCFTYHIVVQVFTFLIILLRAFSEFLNFENQSIQSKVRTIFKWLLSYFLISFTIFRALKIYQLNQKLWIISKVNTIIFSHFILHIWNSMWIFTLWNSINLIKSYNWLYKSLIFSFWMDLSYFLYL